MIVEAELFVMAERVLVEVLGRIRPEDDALVLPPVHGRAGEPEPLADAVARHGRDEQRLVALLTAGAGAGSGASGLGDAGLGDAGLGDAGLGDAGLAEASAAERAEAACAAARQVEAGAVIADVDGAPAPVEQVLLRATVERALLAHYIAAYLGSTACPLPEELARPLWELTVPQATTWRERGDFRAPMPLPDHVSWRDRFLLDAGHEPHPLGH